MKPKVLLLSDDPREVLAFQQIFPGESVDLLLAKNCEEVVTLVQNNQALESPVIVLFISLNHHQTQERIDLMQRVREIDSKLYFVAFTDATGQVFKGQLRVLETFALLLKKPFDAEEVKQFARHFIQSWQKDVSLVQLQENLKNKMLEKLFEASMYDLLSPVLLSVTDKVNTQAGLLDFLRNQVKPSDDDKKTFKQITDRLYDASIEMNKTIRVMQQLFSDWDEVTVLTVQSARQRVFNIIPELQNLPDDIDFKIDLKVDPELSLSLPINLLILSVSALLRNALESVNRKLLNSNQVGEKGEVLLRSQMLDNGCLELIVADNGEGFDDLKEENIVLQKDKSRTVRGFQAGIGLSVVNAFVEKVNGRFAITSEGKGRGATARLSFPLTIHHN